MLEYVAYALVGIVAGCFTGLIPGIHVNTVAVIVLGIFYAQGLDPLDVSVFIVAMGITHSFMDFVPSIFLGAPDPSTVLTVQPGHRMLLSGRGFEALFFSVAGGVFGILFMAALFILLLYAVPTAYSFFQAMIPVALVLVLVFMVAIDRKPLCALVVTAFSAVYGVLLMDTRVISERYVLFVMLTGLFAVSTLVLSYETTRALPVQRIRFRFPLGEALHGSFAGFVGGIVAGVLPGVGSSQSAIIVQKFGRIKGARRFVTALGTINTIAIFMSVMSIYMIGRARSGSAVVIDEILGGLSFYNVSLLLGVALFSTGVSALLTLGAGRAAASNIHRVNYRMFALVVIVFLFALVFYYTGFFGIAVCVTGAFIGMMPNLFGTKKSLLLSSLIVPTIFYLAGMNYLVLGMIGL